MEHITVNIKQIHWLDKENPEAEVLFEIHGNQLWAFCHPCNFSEGETVDVYFSFIEEDISRTVFWEENKEQKKEIIPSESNKCYYNCYGQIKGIHPVIVDCGAIILSYGDWINDERIIGSYVYFVISRLDIGRLYG